MKILKRVGLSFLALILAVVGFGVFFVNCSPQFGGMPTTAQVAAFAKTNHFKAGLFVNLEPFSLKVDCHSISAMLKKAFNPPVGLNPKKNIEVQKIDPKTLTTAKDLVIWLGHSSLILRLDGKTILVDPVWSKYAAPIAGLGRPRYNKEMSIAIKDLPKIDVLIISHDHYDHLDYATIREVAPKTALFLVPLGVSAHLRRWGVEAKHIAEIGWWQEKTLGSLKFALTPAQHMSGRGLTNRFSTLWGSWVILGSKRRVFYSGDGGFGSHFKKIGAKYGPFDMALMECGQYDKLWSDVHMTPEQTVQAGIDVKAKLVLPVHWGAFTLANHPWTEPVKRFTRAANAKKMKYATPEIGVSIELGSDKVPTKPWWTRFE